MPGSRDILADLVAFDTVSRESNLALIDYVRDYLAGFGVDSELFFDADATARPISMPPSAPATVAASAFPGIPAWCRRTARPGACRRSGSASAMVASTGVARRT